MFCVYVKGQRLAPVQRRRSTFQEMRLSTFSSRVKIDINPIVCLKEAGARHLTVHKDCKQEEMSSMVRTLKDLLTSNSEAQ